MRPGDFRVFFREVHGHEPFPWQQRLATEVLAEGWPDVLDLPTASGKTSAVDVAMFCLAADPARHPRRVVFVVDRRVVVDQAAEHARKLAHALATASSGIVADVSRRLRSLWDGPPGEDPLTTAVMRGAAPRDDDWARRPDQPVVALSTVDQVGSRLLFRGYGVSEKMAPIHAGLLGNDTLILLDEVHLSTALSETLIALRGRWRTVHDGLLPDRWGVVLMSATPGTMTRADRTFSLAEDDRADERLARRLGARKPAKPIAVNVRGAEADRRRQLASRAVDEALSLMAGGARAVAIVLNRVDAAREASRLLESRADEVDTCLLTGRMRPIDRDAAVERVLHRIATDRTRDPSARPLVVVATQCIEAGADFDFDGLVSECASIDALRQRFGRVDRRGELGETHGVVLGRVDQVDTDAVDPIYDRALAATWGWITSLGDGLDFGVDHLELPDADALAALRAPVVHAPILLPAHVDTWVQTCPRPRPEPDVALYLHGPKRSAPDVSIVWRADVTDALLDAAAADVDGTALEELVALVAACPPAALEAMTVPLHAARAWLAGAPNPEVGDTLVGAPDDDSSSGGRALRWRGSDSTVIDGSDLEPGDTLVVPASRGGIRAGNWDPECREPAVDHGDRVQWLARRCATLRIHPATLRAWGMPEAMLRTLPVVPSPEMADADPSSEIADWLSAIPADLGTDWSSVVRALGSHPRRIAVVGDIGTSKRWVLTERRAAAGGEVSSDGEDGAYTGQEVGLAAHCADVKRWAEGLAKRLGLGDGLVADLGRAAWLHDIGKADPRFQRMLVGGSEIRAAGLTEPIAKSAIPQRDRRAREEARRRARYPARYRHELLSVHLAERTTALLDGCHDRELVLHLVGSHHGWCRPFAPPFDDEEDLEVSLQHGGATVRGSTRHGMARLDSGVSDRFWKLTERYGWWGLAWLEAILRLADHRASETPGGGT
jgi:CRISPR-associated endonuclease/helicase Cas3